MKEYLGTKRVKVNEHFIDSQEFGNMSPISRSIIENSRSLFKESLLSSSKKEYNKAMLFVTGRFFDVKGQR